MSIIGAEKLYSAHRKRHALSAKPRLLSSCDRSTHGGGGGGGDLHIKQFTTFCDRKGYNECPIVITGIQVNDVLGASPGLLYFIVGGGSGIRS